MWKLVNWFLNRKQMTYCNENNLLTRMHIPILHFLFSVKWKNSTVITRRKFTTSTAIPWLQSVPDLIPSYLQGLLNSTLIESSALPSSHLWASKTSVVTDVNTIAVT